MAVRPGNVLVAVHDPNNLRHLRRVLDDHDPTKSDVVALSVNPNAARDARDLTTAEQVMDECETRVFSKVVYAAETVGKPVALVAVPGADVPRVILQAAQHLRSARVVISQSSQTTREEQEREFRHAWQRLESPRPPIALEIVPPDSGQEIRQIDLGTGPEGGPTDRPITGTARPRSRDGF